MTSYELMNAIQGNPDSILVMRDGDTFWHIQSAIGKPGYIVLQPGGQFSPSMINSSGGSKPSSQPNQTYDYSQPMPGSGSAVLASSSVNPDGTPANGSEVQTEAPVTATQVSDSEANLNTTND